MVRFRGHLAATSAALLLLLPFVLDCGEESLQGDRDIDPSASTRSPISENARAAQTSQDSQDSQDSRAAELGADRVPREVRQMLREMNEDNVERTIRKLVSFGTRNTLSVQDNPTRGVGAARDWLKSQLDAIAATSGGRMTVELQSYLQPPAPRVPVPTVITNVVATLRGVQPQSQGRTYVVSGHYDSRASDVLDATIDAPGANDDASGVAAVLEMARVMATRTFDATIVFMAVAGEEQGLLGANHFATTAKAAGRDIAAMFTNDIVGSSRADNGARHPREVRLFAEGVPTAETPAEANTRRSVGGENDSPARQLARFIKDASENSATGMRINVIYRRDRYLRGGDHIPFLEQGYAAVRFTEPNENYAHQHQTVRVENGVQFGDLPEFVDFAYTTRVARVNAAALAALARAPASPKNTRIITAQLTNDTSLAWDANVEPDLAGYEIVFRDTTEAFWTDSIPVGNVTSFTVKNMSKDNVFFGVRAVDREGHRSPVSFPRPSAQ
ncbi:M20/M25/M40 family metallo-hydrolase [Pendulispora albinea]|uniref:M20/M25/M40 family metallo-hydrolase n=1 Tax=Pendulispora albinea TaxID=2741071 RepID=A0ABZ2LXX6_9BACT